jgi:hypothetical protein
MDDVAFGCGIMALLVTLLGVIIGLPVIIPFGLGVAVIDFIVAYYG